MDMTDSFERLALALAIGLLIGVERGWQTREYAEGQRTAGIRTFALTGLLGGVLAAISLPDRPVILAFGFAAYTAALAAFAWRQAARENQYSVTTVVAGMLAFGLGAFAVVGDMRLAAASAVAATALLSVKAMLHGWLRRLEWHELRAALILLAMTFVMLPLLPNRTIDPWQALNPHGVWVMTISIAAVSFAGYVAVRVFGERRGVMVAALAGGLVASTAVTLTFARLARSSPTGARLLAGGAVAAGSVMMLRVLGVATAFAPALFASLAAALLPAAAANMAVAWATMRNADHDTLRQPSLGLTNPFELGMVLKFGMVLAAVFVVSRWVQTSLGDQGLYALAALSGLADVDAITLSMARLSASHIGAATATIAILIVVASNTLCKVALGWSAGGLTVGVPLALAGAASIAAGAAGFLLGGEAWTGMMMPAVP